MDNFLRMHPETRDNVSLMGASYCASVQELPFLKKNEIQNDNFTLPFEMTILDSGNGFSGGFVCLFYEMTILRYHLK